MVDAVNGGDSTTVLAVSTVSITAVAVAIFVIDLLHPLLDPRIRTEYELMFVVVRDLIRYNREFPSVWSW